MPLTTQSVIQSISKIDGEIGANVANTALYDLLASFNDKDFRQVDERPDQVQYINELDDVIAELVQFRELMVTAINQDADDIPDAQEMPRENEDYKALYASLSKINPT